jgi:hypothetical protein
MMRLSLAGPVCRVTVTGSRTRSSVMTGQVSVHD